MCRVRLRTLTRCGAGRIALAGSGTLLLDDLHTLDLGAQKQLLQDGALLGWTWPNCSSVSLPVHLKGPSIIG